MNKYNLQVGDKIRILSLWEIKEISEEGIILKGKCHYFPWNHVNRALDDGTWSIKERAPSTEYKIGETITFKASGVYKEKGEKDEPSECIYEINSRVIKDIQGEFFQLKGDHSLWFKLSDLPPKTENMQEYKVGDVVITEGYTNDYDGKPLEITKIDKISLGTYCYFTPCESRGDSFALSDIKRLATPEEIKQYNMKEKKILGYKFKEEYKHLEAAACKIAFANTAYANETTFASVPGWNDKNTNFGISSGSYIKLKAAGVLDLWFEPVYKSQETILKLGDKKIEIKIGQKSILADGKAISREHVSEIVSIMEGDLSINFLWPVQFPTVKIGCTTFTQDEVEKILFTYDELNP